MKSMNRTWKKILKYVLFAGVGALLGFVYYKTVGCASGNCAITSSMSNSMLYGGLWGFWISWMTSGGCCCGGSCNIDPGNET